MLATFSAAVAAPSRNNARNRFRWVIFLFSNDIESFTSGWFLFPGTCAVVVSVGENVGVLVEKEKLAWSENFSFVVY